MKIESLKFEGVTFGYEGQDPLFDLVDFNFPMNKIIWVQAASSGEGKSSLLQLMAGLQTPWRGQYLINDQNVVDMSFEEFLPFRMAIGYGFDYGGLIHNRTLLENVILPLQYHKLCSDKEAIERGKHWFQVLGVSKYQDLKPAMAPGRVKKMTCLLRAVVTEPQVLVLDDPSVGLEQETILKYFDEIGKHRSEGRIQSVFLSSYDEKFMKCLDHQSIFLDSGQIYDCTPEGVQKNAVSL